MVKTRSLRAEARDLRAAVARADAGPGPISAGCLRVAQMCEYLAARLDWEAGKGAKPAPPSAEVLREMSKARRAGQGPTVERIRAELAAETAAEASRFCSPGEDE